MIWNTIAHPRMMNPDGEEGNTDTPVVFSEEALESPIKHMNRDLLSTFDLIVMFLQYGPDVLKITRILGDFDTVYRAAKTGTHLHVAVFEKYLAKVDRDGQTIMVPSNDDFAILGADTVIEIKPFIVFEGIVDMTHFNMPDIGIVDFKNDRFLIGIVNHYAVVLASDEQIYLFDDWAENDLPKYKVTNAS